MVSINSRFLGLKNFTTFPLEFSWASHPAAWVAESKIVGYLFYIELCPGPGNRDGKCGKREGIPSPSRSPREAGFRDGRSLTRVNVFGLFTRNLRSFLIVPKTSNTIDHKGSKSALKCSNSTTIEQPPPSPMHLSLRQHRRHLYLLKYLTRYVVTPLLRTFIRYPFPGLSRDPGM